MRRTHQLNISLNDVERARVVALGSHLGLDQCDVVRHLLKRADDDLRRSNAGNAGNVKNT